VITGNFEVQVQQTVCLDFAMQVGEVNESVQVQGLADQLQSDSIPLVRPRRLRGGSRGNLANVGRNTLVGPGIRAFDLAAHKEFPMPFKEGHLLKFRLEAFNVLNHPSWSNPSGNILAGAAFPGQPSTNPHQGFGVISGTAVQIRQVQVALKYTF
jgi:hypothetical protein